MSEYLHLEKDHSNNARQSRRKGVQYYVLAKQEELLDRVYIRRQIKKE